MRCECCGRETDILIEIGAVSPRVATTGKCCVSCCTFILQALEDRLEEKPARQAEWVSVSAEQTFVDEYGEDIGPEEIRFGMKDAAGKTHYFCIRSVEHIPEKEAFEIYPKGESDPERTVYEFRAFGMRKKEEELLTELLLKIDTALMNPVSERYERPGFNGRTSLRERGYVQIDYTKGEVCFRIDGRRRSRRCRVEC